MPVSSRSATRGFHNRIAVVFDFDRTLSSGTIDALLDALGVDDHRHWREERLQPMIEDDWDEILAKATLLVETANERDCALTRDLVVKVGRGLEAYPGVEETLKELREIGAEAGEGAKVELYVLSSGFVDMMAQAPIARVHSEKARYLLAMSSC